MRQHFVVGTAHRKSIDTDSGHGHRRPKSGQGAGQHLPLAPINIVVVEGDHPPGTGHQVTQPHVVDAIQERERDHANTDPMGLLKASVSIAIQDQETGQEFAGFLRTLLDSYPNQ